MVFLEDRGSRYDASLDEVWEFLSSPEEHTIAHRHRNVQRDLTSEREGTYSWEQPFDGAPARFSMHWRSFHPVGIVYDVLDGPFTGSRFFLYYLPHDGSTEVVVAGDFVSPTLPPADVPRAVERFFRLEFEQDSAAIAARRARRSPRPERP